MRSDGVKRLPASVATGNTFLVRRESWNFPVPSVGQFASLHSLPLLGQVAILLLISREAFIPFLLRLSSALDGAHHMLSHFFRHEELRIRLPAVTLFGKSYLFFA